MQLGNKAKFLYLGCLILILFKLRGHISKSQADAHWQASRQLFSQLSPNWRDRNSHQAPYTNNISLYSTQPLMMAGEDPYIRALMRTITASEANVKRPYNVIYGGQYVDDLSRHPEVCAPIIAGSNVGQCSTAAGRYQMLDFTWSKQAQLYHPRPSGIWRWKTYSFEAKYQDAVVYEWLSDSNAWGTDIRQLLRQGKITQILKLLSGTWTSLGIWHRNQLDE